MSTVVEVAVVSTGWASRVAAVTMTGASEAMATPLGTLAAGRLAELAGFFPAFAFADEVVAEWFPDFPEAVLGAGLRPAAGAAAD